MSRRIVGLCVLAAFAWARPASGDAFILTAEFGEQYLYVSPWGQAEPLTDFGLRFYMNDNEVDFGLGLKYARNWGGELANAGMVGADFAFRFHEDLWNADEDFVPFGMFGATYSHRWAELEGPAPGDGPADWTTRQGFGLRAGGGFFVVLDEFYFDLTLYGLAELLWPEPAWVAGGGVDLAFGIYIR